MFGNIGFTEILVILLIALLLFGAKRLPEVFRAAGKSIQAFKAGLRETEEEIRKEPEKPAPGKDLKK